MDIYILIGFLYFIGGLYACGIHYSNKEYVIDNGTEEQKDCIEIGGYWQYVVVFILWPHFLGSNR